MTKLLAATLFVIAAATFAVSAMPPPANLGATTSSPSLPSPSPSPWHSFGMPAPQAPFDTTEITAVETVGASRND